MTCREVMTKDPTFCVPSDTVANAAEIMRAENVGSVPVCESAQSRKLVGIVTDRDLALLVVAECRDATRTKVQEVMTSNPYICHVDDDLQKVLDTMQLKQVRRVPLVDKNDRLVGIIAQADIATRSGEPEITAEVVEEISKPVATRAA
jgi:CBS domain-containing protein